MQVIPGANRSPRLAVLIDADNVPAHAIDALFDEIARLGEASARRIYGDFSGTRLAPWRALLRRLAIIPQQQFAYTVGKNASDIALVIDAMDLLHSGRFDGFCLVSSDSDFTRLALHIREKGVDVFGFGERKTPESFRQACKQFIYIENLSPTAGMPAPDPAPVAAQAEPPPAHAAAPVPAAKSTPPAAPAPAPSTVPPEAVLPLVHRALMQMDDDDGWVHVGALGGVLRKLAPDFDSRTYGHAKLSNLLVATGGLDVARRQDNPYVRIKARPAPGATKPRPPAGS